MTAKNDKAAPEPLNFEQTISQLDAVVEALEKNETSLEESLKAFERGITLTRSAQKALMEAEQKVQVLLEENGEVTTQPLAEPEE
jgi:exodeoxyribonuclease VII small subunit